LEGYVDFVSLQTTIKYGSEKNAKICYFMRSSKKEIASWEMLAI